MHGCYKKSVRQRTANAETQPQKRCLTIRAAYSLQFASQLRKLSI